MFTGLTAATMALARPRNAHERIRPGIGRPTAPAGRRLQSSTRCVRTTSARLRPSRLPWIKRIRIENKKNSEKQSTSKKISSHATRRPNRYGRHAACERGRPSAWTAATSVPSERGTDAAGGRGTLIREGNQVRPPASERPPASPGDSPTCCRRTNEDSGSTRRNVPSRARDGPTRARTERS